MRALTTGLSVLLLAAAGTVAADDAATGELTKIKEKELEEVRQRISALKQSMDAAAADRDRLTAELQKAELTISEKRLRLAELERERDYSTRRRVELDAALAARRAEL